MNGSNLPDDYAASARRLIRTVPGASRPGIDDFLRHAQRHGPEQVIETAAAFLDPPDLLGLVNEVNRLAAEQTATANARRRGFREAPKAKLSAGQRLLLLAAFVSAGVPNSRIAVHLGMSTSGVEKMRARAKATGSDAKATPTGVSREDDHGVGVAAIDRQEAAAA